MGKLFCFGLTIKHGSCSLIWNIIEGLVRYDTSNLTVKWTEGGVCKWRDHAWNYRIIRSKDCVMSSSGIMNDVGLRNMEGGL